MYKVVKVGEKEVPMLAMASANIYYKRVFGRDPIAMQADGDMSIGDNINFCMEMGYIISTMADAKGDRAKLATMSEDGYLEWLDQFDTAALVAAAPEIAAVYNGQNASASVPKKADA